MKTLIESYIEEINFEEIPFSYLTSNKIESLENKEGLIILTNTTNLWIHRDLSTQDFLGKQIVMESIVNFSILDDFGVTIWTGDAESIVEYVEGFIE